MKRILFLNGSPRKKGNTSVLLDYFKSQMQDSFHIENVFLYEYLIKPCTDCRFCKTDELECIIDDGMDEIYEKINKSELLVIGTPIYWFGPSAVTKLLLDRFRPYYVNKKLNNKKVILLLPAGTGESDCDLTIEMFKRSFKALGVELIGTVTSEAYDAGDSLNDKKALKEIEQLTKII